MERKNIFIISLLFMSAVVKDITVNGLECYVCQNCETVTDADVLSCDSFTSSTPGSTSSSTATLYTTTPSASSSSSSAASSTASPTAGSTASPTTSSTASSTASSTTANIPSGNGVKIVKREVTSESDSELGNCVCTGGGKCDCLKSILGYRQARANKFVCVAATGTMNGTSFTVRTCAIDSGDGKVCDNPYPSEIKNFKCRSCDTDKCNSGVSLHFSIFLFISIVFMTFV